MVDDMSQRILIVGVSEMGKSSLARRLIAGAGLPYFVFDPIVDEWPDAEIVTPDFDEFCVALGSMSGEPRIAVVDESGDVFQVGMRHNHWLFTRGRHDAILPIAIAQRMTMIAPNVRSMASDLYLFGSSMKDCETLARDYNAPALIDAVDFVQGEFFHCRMKDGKRCLTRHKLF
jgi:hypothetical protein